jgi:hypothetical protein
MQLLRSRAARIMVAAAMVLVLLAMVFPFQALLFGSHERTMASATEALGKDAIGHWLSPSGGGDLVVRTAHSLCTSAGEPAGEWWVLQVGIAVPEQTETVARSLRSQFDVVRPRAGGEWEVHESTSAPAGWSGLISSDGAGSVIVLTTQVRRHAKDDLEGWTSTCETVSA